MTDQNEAGNCAKEYGAAANDTDDLSAIPAKDKPVDNNGRFHISGYSMSDDDDENNNDNDKVITVASDNRIRDGNSILMHKIRDGFQTLRQLHNKGGGKRNHNDSFNSIKMSQSGSKLSDRPVNLCATVNFINPTTNLLVSTPSAVKRVPDAPTRDNVRNTSFGKLFGAGAEGTENDTAKSSGDDNATGEEGVHIDLYEQLTTIFDRDYASTLHSVPYKNIRTGNAESINQLYIRSVVASANKATDGDTITVTDPAEWHRTPHCHVYIAAIENLDHYKSKVRPSLQAFISQIEGLSHQHQLSSSSAKSLTSQTSSSSDSKNVTSPPAVKSTLTRSNDSSDTSTNICSSHYVIVYVPIVNESNFAEANNISGATPTGRNARNLGFGSGRKNKSKPSAEKHKHVPDEQVHGEYVSTADTDDDTMSTISNHTVESSVTTSSRHASSTSKAEKEIFTKLTKDFPKGKICKMSSLLHETVNSTNNNSSRKTKEWDTFLRLLGSTIVSGFKDRCRRYDDELRRLDAKRAGISAGMTLKSTSRRASSNKKNSKGSSGSGDGGSEMNDNKGTTTTSSGADEEKISNDNNNEPFDLSHFFLVKESLAFTYEQMQLPGEALLQYDELGAFVLDAVSSSSSRPKAPSSADANINDGNNATAPSRPARSAGAFDGFLNSDSFERYLSSSGVSNDKSSNGDENDGTTNHRSAMITAVGGDTVGFRSYLRGCTDLVPVLPLILQYLFGRETSLLFQLSAPVEIIRRTHLFITTIYNMRIKAIEAAASRVSNTDKRHFSDEQYKQRLLMDVEAWALGTCWDIKCASNYYFAWFISSNSTTETDKSDNGNNSKGTGTANNSNVQQQQQKKIVGASERDAACKMSELLEFAFLRFLRLGDADLDGTNPVRRLSSFQPDDMKKPWSVWDGRIVFLSKKKEGSDSTDASSAVGLKDGKESGSINSKFVGKWLEKMCSSCKSYEEKYLELTSAIVTLCQLAGRTRSAARLEAERAEIFIGRGEYELAESILVPIVDVCAEDQWDRGHVWRLFRLVCCQRMLGDAPAYLNTLTRCFGSRLSTKVPAKTAELLQQDLEAVVGDEELAKYHLGVSPFLDTELTVEATSSGKSVAPLVSIRRKVVKNFCTVGETAVINLYLTSHLPKSIEVDSIKLHIVTFDKYESIYMDTPSEEDSFRVLALEEPITVNPDKNEYKFNWIPMNTGQYILSALQIRWKSSCFIYRTCALRKPLMGIDVLPSDPTQTIELNPLFLIPGHVQPVRIVFHSGSDVITEGSVELICSEGLQVIPPGADPNDEDWSQSCRMLLPPCGAGEKIVLTTSVKSKIIGNMQNNETLAGESSGLMSGVSNIQTMHAKVATFYHHGLYNEEDEMKFDIPAMKTVLEAMVTTLDRAALTVDDAEAYSFGGDKVLVQVSLHCNTPVPFYIKEWEICLPAPLRVEVDGDLNKDLFGHAVAEGEQLNFGFKCVHYDDDVDENDENHNDGGGINSHDIKQESNHNNSAVTNPILHVVLQDEFGKTFNQVLALDSLNDFYEQIRQEDELALAAYNSVSVILESSSNEGLVGSPVAFTYRVDTSTLAKPTRRRSSIQSNSSMDGDINLYYSLSCSEMDWVLGGQVQGIIETNYAEEKTEFTLEFIGIPTRPGVIDRFPSISFKRVSSPSTNQRDDQTPHITVQSQLPDLFKSSSFVNHMALACPAGIS